MSRVIHFEIHAEDPERAIQFYTQLFGWDFQKWDGPVDYWTITTGPPDEPGINGGLVRRKGPGPLDQQAVSAYVCTTAVEDLDVTLTSLAEFGGFVVVPKMPIPGIGWLSYARDPEGNIFGMMQSDETAR